jgi:RNA polymerase sigma factor (sigma-70 family)
MSELTDHEVLSDFARTGSEEAFGALVLRHVNLVYSTALRFTGNPHHAEEITQAVFIILARKAGALSPRVVLSGWLYQTTRLTAANFMKAEFRRQRREQEAYMQSTLNEPDSGAWQQIAPLLEDAMGRLGDTDRNAIVLRFFENKTAAEAASILNLSEAATHKRTNRALDKLRKIFSKQGVSSTTAIISGAIATHSVHVAPAAVSHSVIATAAAKGAAASASTLTIIQGGLKLMAWTKTKTAVAAGVGVLLGIGTAALVIKAISHNSDMATLQGTWTGSEIGAGDGLATVVVRGSTLEFRGANPAEWYKATFSLRHNTSPKQAVLVIIDNPEPDYMGKIAHAIYKLEGDTFTVVGNEPGDPSLPSSFDNSTGRKFVLKKKSSETSSILAASTAGTTANATATPMPDVANAESIPGWGDVINPDGDCTLVLADGKLTVDLPGTDHALMPERHRENAPRVMQEITSPFDVQVKVTQHFKTNAKTIVAGRSPYQDAGLLLWMGEKDNLKLAPAQVGRDGRSFRYFHLEFRHDGQYGELQLPRESTRLLRAPTYYLRLQIHNDKTTASVSGDGVQWFSTSLPGSGAPQKMQVGLIAENNTTSPLTVNFEEFSVSHPGN